MADSCYICRRTQAELDRLNEETRTRVYLSYFTNARAQLDEQRQKLVFLQRLKDEESGDPHFRINAKQVFGDPQAYEKLMPWIDQLIAIAHTDDHRPDDSRSIGALVEGLLLEEHHLAGQMEENLDKIRAAFADPQHAPLVLEKAMFPLPVGWTMEGSGFRWRPPVSGETEPLRRGPGDARVTVDVHVSLCSLCRRIVGHP